MENDRCACCLRDLSELRPFGRGGYRFSGDFDGQLLCLTNRPIYPPNALEDKLYIEYFGECFAESDYEQARKEIYKVYGEEIAIDISNFALGKSAPVWLCRHCVGLNWNEYQEKMRLADLLKSHRPKGEGS